MSKIGCFNLKKRSSKKKENLSQETETPLAKVWRLEYGSTDSAIEDEHALELEYYEAKREKIKDSKSALDGFRRVVLMEKEPGEWGFRALKQMIKIHSRRDDFQQMQDSFSELLPYVNSVLTPNYAEKSIGNLLVFMKSAGHHSQTLKHLSNITLETISVPPHDKLWFRVKGFVVDMCVDDKDFDDAHSLIDEMRQFCEFLNPQARCHKQTELLTICNRQIEICALQNDKTRLKELCEEYNRLKFRQAV